MREIKGNMPSAFKMSKDKDCSKTKKVTVFSDSPGFFCFDACFFRYPQLLSILSGVLR